MISSALFIKVAESIVIFGPMFQVGCFDACSGVTSLSSLVVLPRNGPPELVKTTAPDLAGLARFQTLKDRRMFAIDGKQDRAGFLGEFGDECAGDHHRFLVRQRDGFPASIAAQVPLRPAAPTIAVKTRSVSGLWTILTTPSSPLSNSTPVPRNWPLTRSAASRSVKAMKRGRNAFAWLTNSWTFECAEAERL